MRSQLTHGVFQAILENRPYVHSHCRRQLVALFSSRGERCRHQTIQRRRFFGLAYSTPAQEGKKAATDNGTKQMVDLVNAVNESSRPPPSFVVAKSFMSFIQGRLQAPGRLSRNQVQFLYFSFTHLNKDPYRTAEGSVRTALEPANIEAALNVLSQANLDPDALDLAGQFAKNLFRHRCKDLKKGAETPGAIPSVEALCAYISVLSSSGFSSEALELLKLHGETILPFAGELPWIQVLVGFEKEGKGEDATREWISLRRDFNLDENAHETLILHLSDMGSSASTIRAVYESPIAGNRQPTTTAAVTAIKSALHSQLPWAVEIAGSLPPKTTAETLDVILLLTAAQGKSADAIETKLEELVSSTPEIRQTLTISHVNAILEFANQTNKLDMAEGCANIARRWNVAPDTRTYMLLIDTRVKEGDIDSALAVFRQLEPKDALNQLPIPSMNQFIKHLCQMGSSDSDYDTLLLFVDRLVETESRIEVDVLSAICLKLLYRHDLEGVSNLLRPLIDSYSPEQLARIRRQFVCYICDKSEPIEKVWEAYQLLNMAFPATPTTERAVLMTTFFERERSDFACLVFGHMRQKDYPEARPTAHTYALCLHGIAHSANATNLHLIHNMFKLDLEVQPTSEILSGLMLAYAACDMPDRAMEFFRDILHSEEGPSEHSLLIFFRVCESEALSNGVEEAVKMMEKLKSLDIQPDAAMYNGYVGALGGHCEVERAAEALHDMEHKTGERPSAFTYVLRPYSCLLALPPIFLLSEIPYCVRRRLTVIFL